MDGLRVFGGNFAEPMEESVKVRTRGAGSTARGNCVDFENERERYDAREQIKLLVADWCASGRSPRSARSSGSRGVLGLYRPSALSDDPRVSDTNPIFERVGGVGRHLIAGTPIRIAGTQRGNAGSSRLARIRMKFSWRCCADAAAVGKLHDAHSRRTRERSAAAAR